jgi:oligopeptidase B
MAPLEGFRGRLYEEMLGRIKQTDLSVPYKLGDYWYFNKTEEGKQYPTYLRSKTKDGSNPELLLDQNEMAKGLKFLSIGAFEPSDDGNLLAFSTDSTGYRQYTLQIKDLRTGKLLPEKIERVTSQEWSNDGKYLFYSQEDPVSKRSDKVFRHTLATNKNDLIYEEKDVLFGARIGRSRDKKMLFITSDAATMNEVRYLAADNPTGEWKLNKKGEKSWIKSGLASMLLGPIGWLYAGSLREAIPASVAYLALAAILSKLPFIMWPVMMVALPLSGIAGVVYALQFNKTGQRQRLWGDKKPKELPPGK